MHKRSFFITSILIATFALQGCQHDGHQIENGGSAEPATEDSAVVYEESGEEHHEDHDDSRGPGEIARSETPITAEVAVGEQAPEGVETVDPAAVVSNPEQFQGRVISFTGTVNGHCVHNRGWFSIEVPGASPPYLRAMTRPAFQVPEGVIGASVTAFGTVDSQELPRDRVEHIEVEHRLGTATRDEGQDTVTLTVIRTTGAVFSPSPSE